MIHELKCWVEPFELIRIGAMKAEVRSESGGRRFDCGDLLILREYDPADHKFTGRWMKAHVTDLVRCRETPAAWDLLQGGGIVVLSLHVFEIQGGSR